MLPLLLSPPRLLTVAATAVTTSVAFTHNNDLGPASQVEMEEAFLQTNSNLVY